MCMAGLRCFLRQGKEPVPGCSGEGTSGWGYCYDPVITQCTKKTVVDCIEPGTFFQQGNSGVENDWGCEANPTTVALCSKEYEEFTRTTLTGLMIGMPELVAPFTKSFTASIKAPGYSRVKARAVAVVTGDRFVSNGERLAFPKSRPLLVLHDPPGKLKLLLALLSTL